MTQSYGLEFADDPAYIITGNEWFRPGHCRPFWGEKEPEFTEWTGNAIIYPEHDLLWISLGSVESERRFKTLENFEKEFNALPRWEATRYAVKEYISHDDEDGRILSVVLMLYDCRTGERLIPGREREVERLRRGIEPMMRGEHYSFM